MHMCFETAVFGSKKGAGCIPGLVFGCPVRFLPWFLAWGCFFKGFFEVGLSRDPAAGHPGATLLPVF